MLLMDICTAVKIGNGAGYFEDAGVGASGEAETISDQLQHTVAGGVKFAVLLDEAWCHLGVAVDFGALVAFQLQLTGPLHPFGDGGRTL